MQIADIIAVLETRKGQNLKATFNKTLKTRKGVEQVVTKTTSIVVRGGIEYDNQKVVVEGRESGELPAENQGLPWGEWVQYPFHIAHKGSDYVRFYAGSGLSFEPKTAYFLDGVQVPKEQVEALCLASEFRKSDEPAPLAMTVKAENVMEIAI